MEQENIEQSPSLLNKKVGNVERESKQLPPSQIIIAGIKEKTEKSDGKPHKVPLVQFLCKHPDKPEPIVISKIKILVEDKVLTKTTWADLDKEGDIQMGSALDDVLKFLDVDCLADTEGKTLHTVVESKDSSFLCLKLFN